MKKTKQKNKSDKVASFSSLVAERKRILLALQMAKRTGQLAKTHQVKQVKKEISRLLTKQRQEEFNKSALSG